MREQHPLHNCLRLTSLADNEALNACILSAVQGYVLKNVRGDDLVRSIRRVAQDDTLLTAVQIEPTRERLRRQITEDQRLKSLSTQERRIFELLSEGLSSREIGGVMFLAEKTLRDYVSDVLAKLGFQRRTEAALHAQRQFPREPDYP